MRTTTRVIAAVVCLSVMALAGIGYAFYSGTVSIEDNSVDTRYSILYVSDSTGGTQYPSSALLSNVPASVTPEQISRGYTFDASSPDGYEYYITFKDTQPLVGLPVSTEDQSVVSGDRSVVALNITFTGLDSLNGSRITVAVGGSSATSTVSDGKCDVVGNSFTTVAETGDTKSTYTGRVHIYITPYSSGTIDITGATMDISAYHTDMTATGKLSLTPVKTTGSSGSYLSKTDLTYTSTPATGAETCILEIEATYDSSWSDGIVTVTVHDKISGTDVSQTCYVSSSGYKWSAHLPVRLVSGTFAGSIEISSLGSSAAKDPHTISTDGAAITFTMKETTKNEGVVW